jgi:hypothetical protein
MRIGYSRGWIASGIRNCCEADLTALWISIICIYFLHFLCPWENEVAHKYNFPGIAGKVHKCIWVAIHGIAVVKIIKVRLVI